MECKKTEKFILLSFDHRLNTKEKAELEEHLDQCSSCRERQKEYKVMLKTLQTEVLPETKPYFWERLHPKLNEERRAEPWLVRKKFGLRAIPVSLLVVMALILISTFFTPSLQEDMDLSQTGIFLLQNANPLEETTTFLSEEGEVNKHIMLLFSSLDDTNGVRRYFP